MVRPASCDKMNVKKGEWAEEEDAKTLAYVSKHRVTAVSKKSGVGKCGKSCKHKCPKNQGTDLKHEGFTPQEEELIINLHAAIGSRWPIIAQQLPGKTDNDVKNYWNSKLKKKLREMGIDHVTHKPFSQIITDYVSIGAFPRPTSSQTRDFSNTFVLKMTEQSPLHIPNFNATNIPTSRDSLLSNNIAHKTESLDLLTQLQAITLVTQAPSTWHDHDIITQPQFCINEYSSSSSSSSPPSGANEGWLPTNFSWRDFLLEDSTLPKNLEEVSPKDSSSQMRNDMKQTQMNNNQVDDGQKTVMMNMSYKGSEFSADSTSSFVEAILDGEQDMFLEFPGLLEEPFFY